MRQRCPLREDSANFLQFCGTENFRSQSYDSKSLIIVNLSMLTINGFLSTKLEVQQTLERLKSKLLGLLLKVYESHG